MPQTGTKQKFKTIVEAVSSLSQSLENTQRSVNNQAQALRELAELLNAIVSIVGSDTIEAAIRQGREEQRRRQEAEMAKIVATRVEAGIFTAQDAVTQESFVVVDESKGGSTSRGQFFVSAVGEQWIPSLVGMRVGGTVTVNGAEVTVKEIYAFDSAKEASYQEAQQPKPAEAPEVETAG